MSKPNDSKRQPKGRKEGKTTKKTTKPKKKATKKPKSTKPKKSPNRYFLVRKAVSEYCKSNYNRRCTNTEIKEIYNELKLRYFDVDKRRQLSPDEIAKEIDKKLAYRNVKSMPTIFRGFDWFNLLPLLVSNDGLFFKADDMIVLDMRSVGMGVYEVPYWNLEDYWQDDLYPDFSEYLREVEDATGRKVSPPPYFYYNESESDNEKRRFVWGLDMERDSDIRVKIGEDLELTEDDVKIGEVAREEGERSMKLLELELEREKGKTRETELSIEKEKTKQKELENKRIAMDLLQKGIIDLDTFKELIK